MRYATHALKDECNCTIVRSRGQGPVAAIPAVILTAVKEPPAKLHDKEITRCILATD